MPPTRPQNTRNIILTGIPRSGTTLLCRLLSECENVIALNEPLSPEGFTDRDTALKTVSTHFELFRASLLQKGTAPARVSNGSLADNAYSEEKGTRIRVVERMDIRFDKDLSEDFLLAMKHCAEFSLLLPELTQQYTVFALIRNPLALLSSWATVNVPVSRGKVAKSQRLLPSFASAIEQKETLLDKQLFILDWYFRQYETLPAAQVFQYEQMVAENGKMLGDITHGPLPLWNLSGRNTNALYDIEKTHRLKEALLHYGGAWETYYPQEDIISLAHEMFQRL